MTPREKILRGETGEAEKQIVGVVVILRIAVDEEEEPENAQQAAQGAAGNCQGAMAGIFYRDGKSMDAV